jgi:hypothetical protein
MPKHGKQINAKDAQILIDCYQKITADLEKPLNDLITAGPDNDVANYLKGIRDKKNCFIFDKGLIGRFFESETITHFLVIQGAKSELIHEQSNAIGEATVILVGCRYDESEDKYVSVADIEGDPGSEHPNYSIQAKFPPENGLSDQIVFRIK